MDRFFFNENFDKIQQPVIELAPANQTDIIPITSDGRCPFLSDDHKCQIHAIRPPICRKFGDETHIHMTCSFQTKDGKERTPKEFERISKVQTEMVNKFLKRE